MHDIKMNKVQHIMKNCNGGGECLITNISINSLIIYGYIWNTCEQMKEISKDKAFCDYLNKFERRLKASLIYLPRAHNSFTFLTLSNCVSLKADGLTQ